MRTNKIYCATAGLCLMLAAMVSGAPSVTDKSAQVLAVSGAAGVRGSVAVDSANRPHIVMTTAPGSGFYFSDYTGSGFSTKTYDSTVIFNSPYFGAPHMEIDSADTAWISSTFWYPNMGIGITVRPKVKTNPGSGPSFNTEDIWDGGTFDVANLSLDPGQVGKTYFASHLGVWEAYTFNSATWSIYNSGSGSVNDGAGGEKAYFWISKAGDLPHADGSYAVKHHATEWSYNNSMRAAAGQSYLTWANWDYYPGMLNDHAYPSVVSDSLQPQVAYMAAEYYQAAPYGIYLNIWRGTDSKGNGSFQFSPDGGLLCLDPDGRTGVGGRYEVQQYPANRGGVWVSWVRGERARLRYVPSTANHINDCGPENDICEAIVVSSICVDSNGDIHMVYIDKSRAVRYRRIGVSGDSKGMAKSSFIPCDFDNNGFDDLCVYYPGDGTWNIWYNNNGTFTTKKTTKFGFADAQAVPADFDGDGKTDLAVYYAKEGQWIVRNSRTGAQWSMQWGWSEAMPVPADYNGNGQANVAVYSPADGSWAISLSPSQTKTIKLGFSDAMPVPGDYNGDGRDDIAIYIPASGNWQAVDVMSGKSILNMNWGWSSARPVPADFTGNGKIDLCVFDSQKGNWYCNFGNGFSRTLNWGGGGMLPVPGRYRKFSSLFNNAQIGVYIPDSGTWALKEMLIDFIDPWSKAVNFGWNEALPPSYFAE